MKREIEQDMIRYLRTLMVLAALMFGAAGEVWGQSLTAGDIELAPYSGGTITKSVNGRVVTLTVTPSSDYFIKASDIVVEKLLATDKANARKLQRSPAITDIIEGKLYATGTTTEIGSVEYPNIADYVFTVPADYDGAYVTATFHSLEEGVIRITKSTTSVTYSASGHYILVDDVNASVVANLNTSTSFTGIFEGEVKEDGTFPKIKGLTTALFQTVNGGTVKNIVLDNVTVSGSTTVTVGNASKTATGAIANVAIGNTRIYNCGVLATGSTVEIDDDGYTQIKSCSSYINASSDYVGGLVGLLDGEARVINCYSYADIKAGREVGGIVGHNNQTTTSADGQQKTMVMNCMFYGDIAASCTDKAPIYNGTKIVNYDTNGVGNFNYFLAEASYVKPTGVDYNCALMAEKRYLQRFEFFRPLLNGHRELAAWWVTGNVTDKDKMAKWVMEPSQIGTTTPYPILKVQGKYPSVVNYEPSDVAIDEKNEHRNEGRKLINMGLNGKLSVTIRMGTNSPFGAPTGARLKSGQSINLSLIITDKDTTHFNFNYGKVQLPYYNDYGIGNYTKASDNTYRVVTGWKIVSISGGTPGSFLSSGDDATATVTDGIITLSTPNNFADRTCTNKDLYGTGGSNRVFNQGDYWDVPDGVTAITIEPYWAKAVFVADDYRDVVFNQGMTEQKKVPRVGGGQWFTTDGETKTFTFGNESLSLPVYSSISSAVTALSIDNSKTVNDYAVVLVGNHHYYNGGNNAAIGDSKVPYTLMSIDLDKDNEPDYSLIMRFDGRAVIHPTKWDFLNLVGFGMAQKSDGGTGSYNFGIPKPDGWFEVTNTALFRVTQMEYCPPTREKKPLILHGGVIEQWVSSQGGNGYNPGDRVLYYHVGDNVWFKEFHIGIHQDNKNSTPHAPISVSGGDYEKFYLTGYYRSDANIYNDDAECYISGGRFGEVAGAGMEGIGTANGKGNITWQIDRADIKSFYGGGINADKPLKGNIKTIIKNSNVDVFCGGPKFGDMNSGRTVVTNATGCTFGKYFGAGYGGTSYNRYAPQNHNNIVNFPHKLNSGDAVAVASWNAWVQTEYDDKDDTNYALAGVPTQIDYQFIPQSGNTQNVARLFVEYALFSLATTRGVISILNNCKIKENFYGGGSLGKVAGSVTSTLTDCEVAGNVFGAGYSATKPKVQVMKTGGFRTEPYYYTSLGTFNSSIVKFPETEDFTWESGSAISMDRDAKKLYTTADLSESNLGSVNGAVTLTLQGDTKVGTLNDDGTLKKDTGNVYGGGDASWVNNPETPANAYTVVTLKGNTEVYGDVFGGGNKGPVSGSATVKIE